MAARAGHALAQLALEPEWEGKCAPTSDGCRPGRSGHEALAALHASSNHQDKYVLEADMAKCFARLCHRALVSTLHTFPAFSRTITAWLKAGVMDGKALLPTETGAPQGGVLSPRLMHVALHGLETVMTTTFPAVKGALRWRPRVMRYADDLVGLPRD
jgi:RNA-directed DNA polymerase